VDNDCDPLSAEGSEDPLNGSVCDGNDTDLCNEGTYSCNGGDLICSDTTSSTYDECNGLDDDCDPASDDGDEDPFLGADCDGPDSDFCDEGIYSCEGGTLSCSDETGDDVEVCDGEDNDCDGTTDEGCCYDHVTDGSVELGPGSGAWDEFSTNFPSPICDVGSCGGTGGGTGPHTGSYWIWFGGIEGVYELATMSQVVNIPQGTASLGFYLEIPACASSGTDVFEVSLDGDLLFITDNFDPACEGIGYLYHPLDVSAYADGTDHDLQFLVETFGGPTSPPGEGVTSFMVDDIDLEVCIE
jgi:hypothetical protein